MKKGLLVVLPIQDAEIYLDLQVQNQLFANLHTPHPPGGGLRI